MSINAVLANQQSWHIQQGDVLDVLRRIPDGVVQCVVTSPPYFALRDYGLAPSVWGGEPDCAHEWAGETYQRRANDGGDSGRKQVTNKGAVGREKPVEHAFCQLCGAWYGCLGLEPTPELYVEHLVAVFREVRRVLRDDGCLWLNLGDSFDKKQLQGIPWRVAFALQADGWWLRSDVIWHKPNCFPESVTDRPTKSHEYVFLLTKSKRYFYDNEAVKEPIAESTRNDKRLWKEGYTTERPERGYPGGASHGAGLLQPSPSGRNKRTVWTISTKPYSESHFATFPPELPEICIKAGSSERGACPQCGAPWERAVENTNRGGWQPSCTCNAGEPIPCLVLDPFAGAGTTLMVALRLGRRALGIELNGEYVDMAERRIAGDYPLFNVVLGGAAQ